MSRTDNNSSTNQMVNNNADGTRFNASVTGSNGMLEENKTYQFSGDIYLLDKNGNELREFKQASFNIQEAGGGSSSAFKIIMKNESAVVHLGNKFKLWEDTVACQRATQSGHIIGTIVIDSQMDANNIGLALENFGGKVYWQCIVREGRPATLHYVRHEQRPKNNTDNNAAEWDTLPWDMSGFKDGDSDNTEMKNANTNDNNKDNSNENNNSNENERSNDNTNDNNSDEVRDVNVDINMIDNEHEHEHEQEQEQEQEQERAKSKDKRKPRPQPKPKAAGTTSKSKQKQKSKELSEDGTIVQTIQNRNGTIVKQKLNNFKKCHKIQQHKKKSKRGTPLGRKPKLSYDEHTNNH